MNDPWNAEVKGTQVLPLINDDGGCIKVEAGPGTGKTFGLEQRVMRLLLPSGLGLSHESLLVVAFNRVIAADLRERITQKLLSKNYAGKFPRITTLHGFCLDILGLTTRILLPHEVDAMAYDIVSRNEELSVRYPTHAKVLSSIRLMESGDLDDALLSDQIAKWLIQHKAGTISDVPGELLQAIKGGDYRETEFDHVIVDEFQDLTPSEQELVFVLCKAGGTIVTLGDPRQSIYRFRGNDRDGLSKLQQLTSKTIQECPMTICQRCPNRFVDAANRTMASSTAAPLEYGSASEDNTHLVHWKTPIAEAEGMAKAIVANIRSMEGDDHLVMTTRRQFGYMLRDEIMLLNDELKVRLVFSESPLETWPVREAFILFCLLTDPDGPTWRSWLGYRLAYADRNHMAPERNSGCYLKLLQLENDVIDEKTTERIVAGNLALSGSGKANVEERAQRFLELRSRWSANKSEPEEFIASLFDSKHWPCMANDNVETVTNDFETIRSLSLELLSEDSFGDPESRLKKVAAKLRTHIAVRDTETGEDEDVDLTIATLWSAKGVTAAHVYVLGLCEEAIPGSRRDDYPGTDAEFYAEQQRLFYVTLTRSKRTLVLSRTLRVKRSDSRTLGLSVGLGGDYYPSLHISPFLRQVLGTLPDSVPGEEWNGC